MERFFSSPRRSRFIAVAAVAVLILTVLAWGPGATFGSPPADSSFRVATVTSGEQQILTRPDEVLYSRAELSDEQPG